MDFLKTGTDARKKLDALEHRLLSLQAEIGAVSMAPVPLDEVRKRLKNFLDDRVYVIAPDSSFGSFQNAELTHAQFPQQLGWEYLVYLFGIDEIVDRLVSRIKAQGVKPGLASADRPKKIEELQSALRQVARDVEIESVRLEKAGYAILRSGSADPEILIEVWRDLPAA